MSYKDLGAQVEAAWAAEQEPYDEKAFPSIAKRLLAAAPLVECEEQRLAMDPPPRVPYDGNPRFQIEIREPAWASAEIRNDAHLGAWRVSDGRAICTRYEFKPKPDQSVVSATPAGAAATAQYGRLEQFDSHLLGAEAGASEIAPVIESVVPLTPLLRIVVIRTRTAEPERLYQRPGVELHDRHVLEELAGKQTGYLGDMIDYARGFYDVIDTLRAAPGLETPELRFFVAALMTQQTRPFLIDLVQDWTGTGPYGSREMVAHWVERLIDLEVLNDLEAFRASPEFFTSSWDGMDPAEAVLFLLRQVRRPGHRTPHGRLPPPV